RQINKIRALEKQLETKKLREHDIILNRWKRLHPIIRNHARMYLKRAESGQLRERNIDCWLRDNWLVLIKRY
ncbi:hypothetical protein K469DRAFT_594787, partial [Zopfia rhizophila CBS 207.26]